MATKKEKHVHPWWLSVLVHTGVQVATAAGRSSGAIKVVLETLTWRKATRPMLDCFRRSVADRAIRHRLRQVAARRSEYRRTDAV